MQPLPGRSFEFAEPVQRAAESAEPIARGFARVTMRAVEEPSDSHPGLRRATVLVLIAGSFASWIGIGVALVSALY
jgi:hypothetical protein